MSDTLVDSAETRKMLVRASEDDEHVFESLLERHLPSVRRSVDRRLDPRLRARVDTSDVIQEVRHYAFEHWLDYLERRPMPFRLWLMKTAHQRLMNIERDHLAVAKRSALREVPLPDHSSIRLAQTLVGRTPSPSHQCSRAELASTVRRCLARLSEQDREILFLRNFEGLSNAEAAALLGQNPETTKKRCTRALLQLRSLVESEGITGDEL